MEFLLVVLTILSLAAAAGFAFVAWRLQREERERSAARVAALSSALDALDTLDAFDEPIARDERVNAATPVPVATAAPVPVASMFRMEPGASVQGRPLIKAAVVGVMAVAVVVAAAMGNRSTGAAASAAVAAEKAPLELMSMRHTREGTTLTVTGLVRNPAGGAEARRVTAVVFAFDRNGGFTASGRAPLDFIVLEPGDESPFVVTIPNVTAVAKYRVSFRTDDGMMRHVDRRAEQAQLSSRS